ncbi:MAG TPA: RNA 3'-terminal phosphate cyclase [Blastocatellia bacterium]|nr:RNA 3'-terminal phosphate cyclase [Blastocatellia bacterium]
MITIDGSYGEGGGQILRTSLALSLVTGKPFRIEKIRAGRKNPGLLRQHLTCVQAAKEIGQADTSGDALGSTHLTFVPAAIKPGDYAFAIGTAGSTTLVLQTVLPALMIADGNSSLILEGGTHNPFSPPFDFLRSAFLPILKRMGASVESMLVRPGFYPAGGGEIHFKIAPATKLEPIDLTQRGEIVARYGRAIVASLPKKIGEREIAVLGRKLSWNKEWLSVETLDNSRGPGNIVLAEILSENVTDVFTGFGERGVPAEAVAEKAVQSARRYLAAEVAVGEYLADQLLLPMALAGAGAFTTLPLSRHSMTNIDIIKHFLDVDIAVSSINNRSCTVVVKHR